MAGNSILLTFSAQDGLEHMYNLSKRGFRIGISYKWIICNTREIYVKISEKSFRILKFRKANNKPFPEGVEKMMQSL